MARARKILSKRGTGKSTGIYISHSSLDWYKLTENTRHILNVVITNASKARLIEMDSENPDQVKIDRLRAIGRKATALTRDTKVFESQNRMKEVMEEYMELKLD